MEKSLFKTENLFLLICIFWGVIFILINPPFQSPDEMEHLYKMWGFTEGTLRYQIKDGKSGQYLPESFYRLHKFYSQYFLTKDKISVDSTKNFLNLKLNKDKKIFLEHVPTSYTPLSYFPSFLILWLMKYLNINPLLIMYILRFCSLMVYLALCYFAIKITPCKKWMLFLYTLLPVCVLQAVSVSTDGLFFGILAMFFAYSLKLAFDNSIKKITRRHIIVWGILITLLSLLKYAYMPFILMYFLISKEKFECNKNYNKNFLYILFINLVLTGIFIFSVMVFSDASGYNNVTMFNKFELIKGIIINPFDYLKLLTISVFSSAPFVLKNMVSSIGVNLNFTMLPAVYIYTYWFAMLVSIFYDDNKNDSLCIITVKQKTVIFGTIVLTIFIILTSLYLVFPTEHLTKGIQGRYFTPLILAGLLLFNPKNINLKWRGIPVLFFIISVFLLLLTSITISNRYY